jgi:hypothetical protein
VRKVFVRPDNRQPAEYVTYSRGFVCLRLLDTISPAVRWFSDADMFAVNPMYTPAAPKPAYQPAWEVNARAIVIWRPTLILSPELAANINHAAGVEIVVRAA